ncbi:putative beta-glucan synthesis-associated protein [Smittium culicis]|uniref:Putative beta-glucan synthesis-associated protein n=2 Tax=Smittium culicis TaxID=133412 RepID=A0A1R1XU93_9FUNG|nr:putative beta-glucan synthesis-associated protein [Smittium culicis]
MDPNRINGTSRNSGYYRSNFYDSNYPSTATIDQTSIVSRFEIMPPRKETLFNRRLSDDFIEPENLNNRQKSSFKSKFAAFFSSTTLNRAALILTALLVIMVFLVPIIITQTKKKSKAAYDPTGLSLFSKMDYEYIAMAKNSSSKGQPLVPKVLPVDPETPASAEFFTNINGEKLKLVFSDEFNTDGRKFGPGQDSIWEAQDLYYYGTNDLEYYSPEQVSTKDGKLILTLENKVTVEPHNYTSGMLNSWNKFCFQGGYIEVRASFPGNGKVPGYWPAAWTLGNLGRAGFGATNDGLLPGQRLNACVCSGDHPSPGIGRGAPEIDIFEGTVEWGGLQTLSMSLQVAPFDHQYTLDTNYTDFKDVVTPNASSPQVGKTIPNTYTGGFLQQSVSSVHYVDNSVSGGNEFGVYGFEYIPGPEGFIQYYVNQQPTFRVESKAVGPNSSSKIGQRVIPEEPMYILLNLGFSSSFGAIDFENIKFPANLQFDYVRLYQDPNNIRLSCDPEDRPTAQYIMDHPRAYYNKDLRYWNQTGYGTPSYDINKGCNK